MRRLMLFVILMICALLFLLGEVILFVQASTERQAQTWCTNPDTGKQEPPLYGSDC